MNTLHLTELNFYAVFAAWIFHTISGLIWFQPGFFGKEWSKLTGKDIKPAKKWIIPGLIGHLVMVFVIVIIIRIANLSSGLGGLLIGLLCWVGFVVPLELGELIWEKIPFRLFLIRIGNQFVGMGISGFILGAWQ
jgi:UDP-N-acetylmuramyl pentapeptide phosphotransferase/UDP-N-acetylglucosamine-1-phosphate transferase